MGEKAARRRSRTPAVAYAAVQQAYVGYVYGDSTCGQAALYGLGLTGIPIINVNNNCSTGSSALFLARQAVASGAADCVLALGFEQMVPGALARHWHDRPSPMARFDERWQREVQGIDPDAPLAAQFFGGGGPGLLPTKYGIDPARVRRRSRSRRASTPRTTRTPCSATRSRSRRCSARRTIYGPLTRLQCCPPTCGAAAAVVCQRGVRPQARARRRAW